MQKRDEELILRSRAGDVEALEELLQKYRPLVRSMAERFYLKDFEAEDFKQEAMIGLYQAIMTYDPSRKRPFAALAKTCVLNRCRDRLRQKERDKDKAYHQALSLEEPIRDGRDMTLGETLEDPTDPEDLLLEAECLEQLFAFFEAELSSYEQKVAQARIKGQSYKEIAEVLGAKEKSIDAALQRVRKKLRERIKERED